MTSRTPASSHPMKPAQSSGPAGIAERFAELVLRQHGLMVQLQSLSREQGRAIDGDDHSHLLDVLQQRGEVIEELTATGAELEPFRSRFDSLLGQVPPGQALELSRMLAQTATIAAAIKTMDEADRVRLDAKRSALLGELGDIDRGRDAVDAYSAASPTAPRLQDRQA